MSVSVFAPLWVADVRALGMLVLCQRRARRPMKLVRESMGYSLVGGAQFLLDWGVLVGLTVLGLPPGPANVISRLAGATLGFWANGKITFPGSSRSSRHRALRFALLWVAMTIISTLAIHAIAHYQTLGTVWLFKPVIEAVLAVASFFICRHWVYR